MGNAKVCPSCGYGPSQSVLGKGVSKVANVTGAALEKGVKVTESVAKEFEPAAKKAVELGKKGVSKTKEETLRVAKALKEK